MRSTICSRAQAAARDARRRARRLQTLEARLAALDPDTLSPRDALAALYELKRCWLSSDVDAQSSGGSRVAIRSARSRGRSPEIRRRSSVPATPSTTPVQVPGGDEVARGERQRRAAAAWRASHGSRKSRLPSGCPPRVSLTTSPSRRTRATSASSRRVPASGTPLPTTSAPCMPVVGEAQRRACVVEVRIPRIDDFDRDDAIRRPPRRSTHRSRHVTRAARAAETQSRLRSGCD